MKFFKRVYHILSSLSHVFNHYQTAKCCGIPFTAVILLEKNRNNGGNTYIFGKEIQINSSFWFLHGLKEIFEDEVYLFNYTSSSPRIIDCGANIGLSLIYFKHLCPMSKIIAFEPDSEIFCMLKNNLSVFGYDDIELINKAVWINNKEVSFMASGGVGGHIGGEEADKTKAVSAIRLRDLLEDSIDFLKIDIEGAEYEVLKDCADKLVNVKNLFVEYHSLEKNEQNLDEILLIIKNAGFKYYIKEAWPNQKNPYTNKRTNLYDLQLNIFGYRLDSL